MRTSRLLSIVSLALLASACGNLLGLGDFHPAEDGTGGSANGGSAGSGNGASGGTAGSSTGASGGAAGAGGSGAAGAGATAGAGAGGSGATAGGGAGGSGASAGGGAGGAGATAGSAGSGAGGAGGAPPVICNKLGSALNVYLPSDLPAGYTLDSAHYGLTAWSPGNDKYHVVLSLESASARRLIVRTMNGTGGVDRTRELDIAESFHPVGATVATGTVTLYATDGEWVTFTFGENDDQAPMRNVIAAPCEVRNGAIHDVGGSVRYAYQCTNGDVYTDSSGGSAVFSSTAGLTSVVYAGGKYFMDLEDDSAQPIVSELRASPGYAKVDLDYGAGKMVLGRVYPSTNPGSATLMTFAADLVASTGSYYYGPFPTAPDLSAAPSIPKIADTTTAGAFIPFRGSHKSGLLAMASVDLDGQGVHMSSLGLDGSLRDWNVEVAKISQGQVKHSSAATLSGLWTAAVWSVETADADGGTETAIKSQVMLCTR